MRKERSLCGQARFCCHHESSRERWIQMVVEVITLGQETTSSLEVICPEIIDGSAQPDYEKGMLTPRNLP